MDELVENNFRNSAKSRDEWALVGFSCTMTRVIKPLLKIADCQRQTFR